MSLFLSSYTKALRNYDRDLYAGYNVDGVVCVFRKHKRFEEVCDWNDSKLFHLRECKQFVFSLTDNWNLSGRPRDWGIEFVLNRIKEIDALANKRMFEEMDAHNEKIDQSKQRSLKNDIEGFWSHERRRFAKATDDILTHSLSKDEPRKRLKDRSIKNGNH